jgi:hypothetical protein
MIIVMDNLLTPSYADAIENEVRNLPYLYNEYTSQYTEDVPFIITTPETKEYGQFVCPILIGTSNLLGSYFFDKVKPIFYSAQDRLQMQLQGLSRVKANILLQQTTASPNHYNIPHQDTTGNTLSMVYYCNDSDGDTFLFNESHSDTPPERLTIKDRITPKKNRAVIFDSTRYHASSNPIHTKARFVLNFVIVKETQ